MWICISSKACAGKCFVQKGKIKRKMGTHSHGPMTKYIAEQERKGLVVYKRTI